MLKTRGMGASRGTVAGGLSNDEPGRPPGLALQRFAGGFFALAGVVCILGLARDGKWVPGGPDQAALLKFSAALGFVLTGSATALQTVQGARRRAAALLSKTLLVSAAVSALTVLAGRSPASGEPPNRSFDTAYTVQFQIVLEPAGLNNPLCLLLASACVWVLASPAHHGIAAWLGALLAATAAATLAAHWDAGAASYNWLNMRSMSVGAASLYALQGAFLVWLAARRARFRWALGRGLTLEFLGGLVLLGAVALLVRWSAAQFGEANAEIRRSRTLLEKTWALRSAIDELDNAARIYVEANRPDAGSLWIENGPSGTESLSRLHAEIRGEAVPDSTQSDRLARLEAALQRWTAAGREALALRDAEGTEAVRRRLSAAAVLEPRAEVYRLLLEMLAAEKVRVTRSEQRLHKELERTFGLLPIGALLGTLVVGYGMARLSLEMGSREAIAKALALSEERQRLAVEAAEIGDWELDPATRLITRSPRYDRIFGYETPAAVWTYAVFIEHVHPEDRARVDEVHRGALDEAGEWSLECRILRRDGSSGWIWLRGKCVKDRQGRIEAVRGIIGDITERKAAEAEIRSLNATLERRVGERTQELELAVKELDAFTYSVSHDLRAPLRAIDGFSKMLAEDHAQQLPGDARRKLAVISSEAQRMSRLIDDLLAFSRLGRAPVHLEKIDMKALANETFAELLVLDGASRAVEFKVRSLPPAVGTRAMVRQVWTNLLSNALKFTRGRNLPVIEVGSNTEPGGEVVYFVRDNGVGFDMRHADKLFGVFQRLHSEKEFEGTGAGLALVHRIVTRHAGRVWAEAAPEKGATFYFTLPKPKP